jgi:SIT family siderophore-iron:H+ symporter-like MFS transporter
MFGIIYTVVSIPLIVALWWPTRRIQRSGVLENHRSTRQMLGDARLTPAVFWQLDIIGIVLLIAVFALILVPFTIAGGQAAVPEQWRQAKVIVPLVLGVSCIPVWLWWESKAKYAMVPFSVCGHRQLVLYSLTSITAA